jgi:hypothetical protein
LSIVHTNITRNTLSRSTSSASGILSPAFTTSSPSFPAPSRAVAVGSS